MHGDLEAARLQHLLDGARLGEVVDQLGSEEAAFGAIKAATETAVSAQGATGTFEVVVKVAGSQVTVAGKVVDGVVKIGTAFVR
jgi:hypothetical protein